MLLVVLLLGHCDTCGPVVREAAFIRGMVKDEADGSPLAGALVSTNPITEQVATDSNGAYLIETFELAGDLELTVTAQKSDYLPDSVVVTAQPGHSVDADFQLRKRLGILGVVPDTLDFETRKNSIVVVVFNQGRGDVFTWAVTAPNEDWVHTPATSGIIMDGAKTFHVDVNREGLCNGNYETTLRVTTTPDVGIEDLPVFMQVKDQSCSLPTSYLDRPSSEQSRLHLTKRNG